MIQSKRKLLLNFWISDTLSGNRIDKISINSVIAVCNKNMKEKIVPGNGTDNFVSNYEIFKIHNLLGRNFSETLELSRLVISLVHTQDANS